MVVQYQTCDCNFCGGRLRFEAWRAGQLVNCPDCLMETILFLPGAEPPYPPEQYVMEAQNIAWTQNPWGVRNLVGTVVNRSAKHLDWVKIEFTLVNAQGLPVGSTSDCLISFPPKALWRFQAPVFQPEATGISAPMLSCEYGKVLRRSPSKVIAPSSH